MAPLLGRPLRSHFRWTVCALLFFATTINYVDRQVLSLLAQTLQDKLNWSVTDYAHIAAAFSAAYGVGLLAAGGLLDRLGTRIGFALAISLWSLAAIGHAFAATAFSFGIARVFLGLGEAANFPACIKTVAEWFPKRERAQATGIFNAGSNIGAVVAPIAVPPLAAYWGWQAAFVITGALGFVWLAFWWAMYRTPDQHPKVSAEEYKHITSDPPERVKPLPWRSVFPRRQTWAFGVGKFLTDPVWWFFLFWLPKFLQNTFHLSLEQIVIPTIVVYNAASVGSVGGGWLSSTLIKRGRSINSARKIAMLTCALCVLPVFYVPFSNNLWVVVGLVSLALAAHQGWSANLFTTASDMFPRAAVGSVVGIGAAAGALGNFLIQEAAGWVLKTTGTYFALFMICGSAYLVALAIFHLLAPRLQPVELD
jgi:ACS family hexuronate transporter-like MFS transporter